MADPGPLAGRRVLVVLTDGDAHLVDTGIRAVERGRGRLILVLALPELAPPCGLVPRSGAGEAWVEILRLRASTFRRAIDAVPAAVPTTAIRCRESLRLTLKRTLVEVCPDLVIVGRRRHGAVVRRLDRELSVFLDRGSDRPRQATTGISPRLARPLGRVRRA